MSTFTKERSGNTPPAGGRDPKPPKGGDMGMKMKPGFSTGVPGKKQPKDRSNGVPEGGAFGLPMNHPQKEGI